MFIQIHTLTGYAGVLLNRDDTGMAKRLQYGSGVRTRTSSQFAKRKIRLAEGEFSIATSELGRSVRSRETFKREIARPLVAAGHDIQTVVDVTLLIMDAIYKPSKAAEKSRKEKLAEVAKGEADILSLLERGEINVLSLSEIEYIKSVVEECLAAGDHAAAVKHVGPLLSDKEFVKNLRAAGEGMSLDLAMFGRMVTGDSLSSVDAAVHVAHAITVHAQAVETDFFTAVDDLVTGDGDKGGGHLGEVEITSPLLYAYYVVDVAQLERNLHSVPNNKEISADMVAKLVRLVAEHVVGAKKGSTAPYSSADLVMVEVGNAQPRTLAEAFRTPTKPTLEAAVEAMGKYLEGKDRMYGDMGNKRMVSSAVETGPAFGQAVPIPQLAAQTGAAITEAV